MRSDALATLKCALYSELLKLDNDEFTDAEIKIVSALLEDADIRAVFDKAFTEEATDE